MGRPARSFSSQSSLIFSNLADDSPLVEVNEVMRQTMEMGEFGRIDNPGHLMKAPPLIEHIFISASPPSRQDQIRTATLQEVKDRPEVLWDARRRFSPRFLTEQDEHNPYINYKPFDGNLDADAAFAQRLQDSINLKDSVVSDTTNANCRCRKMLNMPSHWVKKLSITW